MPVIITIIIAIFLILISWTWRNLGEMDKTKKIITIIFFLLLIYICTLIIFNISKANLNYNTEESMKSVRRILVLLFTLVNGIVVMPAISKVLNRKYENEIDNQKIKKNLIIIFVIFIIILVVECGYLKNIQQGILNIYYQALQNTK